ncbi:CLUMA_CG007859, isoform A [Clunio marinus]|uniref:CLUMA_CG007859, isoform A n=1 Tax=Clunio marinus TaxID=568069 RepID=A0A1J1I1Z0_9DIPT|nr:CLUMA_CG007859, isoform A [Clunio marinus]
MEGVVHLECKVLAGNSIALSVKSIRQVHGNKTKVRSHTKHDFIVCCAVLCSADHTQNSHQSHFTHITNFKKNEIVVNINNKKNRGKTLKSRCQESALCEMKS